MLDYIWKRIQIDWWEVTHTGPIVGYWNFLSDWVKYLTGRIPHKPNLFAYSEKDMDLEFDFTKDSDDPAFNRMRDLE